MDMTQQNTDEAKAIAEFKIDRTNWTAGEWDDEPDRIEWREQGVPCLMSRNRMGAWCGYVGVTKKHKWHGQSYSVPYDAPEDTDRSIEAVSVHGGLTYSDSCRGHLCHIPVDGEDPDVWWLGFDCGHDGDLIPGIAAIMPKLPGLFRDYETYKNANYVKQEIKELVRQVLDAA